MLNSHSIEPIPSKVYINRCLMYLGPTINLYSQSTIGLISRLNILIYATEDVIYTQVKRPSNQYLLYLICTVPGGLNARRQFAKDLRYLRLSSEYTDDYVFNLRQRTLHAVVLKCKHKDAYNHFKAGEFSKMYTKSELGKLGIREFTSQGVLNKPYLVLTKDPRYLPVFNQDVQEYFGTNIDTDPDSELDTFWVNPTIEKLNT